uniref:Uncharacterized protein n=1 Tax=Rhizophagus irregularis (strain DAOM 181602 / DAOM 197198 / MUCL 43194) TaxID=747089 RepID=U9SJ19_RHIID
MYARLVYFFGCYCTYTKLKNGREQDADWRLHDLIPSEEDRVDNSPNLIVMCESCSLNIRKWTAKNRGKRIINYRKEEVMRVSNEMALMDARVLPTPTIHYRPSSRENRVRPIDGTWNLHEEFNMKIDAIDYGISEDAEKIDDIKNLIMIKDDDRKDPMNAINIDRFIKCNKSTEEDTRERAYEVKNLLKDLPTYSILMERHTSSIYTKVHEITRVLSNTREFGKMAKSKESRLKKRKMVSNVDGHKNYGIDSDGLENL